MVLLQIWLFGCLSAALIVLLRCCRLVVAKKQGAYIRHLFDRLAVCVLMCPRGLLDRWRAIMLVSCSLFTMQLNGAEIFNDSFETPNITPPFSNGAPSGWVSEGEPSLTNVSIIEIRNAANEWLQVSEVIASEVGSGSDLALASAGATATGTGNYSSGSNPDQTIDGVGPSSYPSIYHSDSSNASEMLTITLAAPSSLESLTVVGRSDCCSNRDVYEVTLKDSGGTVLFNGTNYSADNGANSVTINFPTTAGASGVIDEASGWLTTPYGEQVVWINSGYVTTTNANLSDVLTADTIYTLSFNVARRTDIAGNYKVELLAGSTVLGSVTGTAASSDFSESDQIVFTASASHPNLGEVLKIRLSTNGTLQPQFDNVRLNTADDGKLTVTAGGVSQRYEVSSYGGSSQDRSGTVEVRDAGSTLFMKGNRWQKIALPYSVTSATVIEFDFESNEQAEVSGIGFDTDLGISANRSFRVYGTQNWGISNYATYSGSGITHYRIPVGDFYTGNFQYLFFVNDDDSNPTGEGAFSNITITEDNVVSLLNVTVDGVKQGYGLSSYGGSQDSGGTVEVRDTGDSLFLKGNRWQKIDLAYTVTDYTMLEFDYESSEQAEVSGIGFDTDLSISSTRTFKVYGSQNWGLSAFNNYPGSGVTSYSIPVGQYYTGSFQNMFFVNDDDSNPTGEGLFSNIVVRDGTLPSVSDAAESCLAEDLVIVSFAEDAHVDDMTNLSNYGIDNGASITNATRQDARTAILTVDSFDSTLSYNLTVQGQTVATRTEGLLGSYYDQRSGTAGAKVAPFAGLFTGNRYYRQDAQVNFSWDRVTPTVFPNAAEDGDRYSVSWDGFLVPSTAGDYEFRLYSDDGMRLTLDGSQILSDWSNHSPRYSSASAVQALAANQMVPIKIEYFENSGRAYSTLQWRVDGGSWEAVPTGNLSSCGFSLNATVDDVSVVAGDSADFTVTLDSAATSDVVINYSTSDITAVAGTDYVATTGSVTILTGDTSGTISIATLNGGQVGNVDFQVNLTSSDVSVTDALGIATITPAGTPTGTLTGNLNVDNRFSAYLSSSDGVQGVLLGSGSDWRTTDTISASLIAGQDYYLHVFAEDADGVAGFLGDFTLAGSTHLFENDASSLTTDTGHWRVSTAGWSSYGAVSGYGQNGVSPWGNIPGVDSSATWIWTSDSSGDNTAYFTTKITAISNSTFLHFAFEQEEFSGAGVVIEDFSENGNTGVTVGNVESTTEGKVCNGAIVGDNSSHSTIDGINSGVDLDGDIGNAGTVMFWYKASQDWSGSGDRTLMDASAGDKYFFLSKQNDSTLHFWMEDTADADFQFSSATNSFSADTWVHLAVTWDMAADAMKAYVNGSLVIDRTMSSNGQLGGLGNLIIGDNASSSYTIAPASSANGTYDDIRIHSAVLAAGEIATLMAETHLCNGIDDVTVAAGETADFTVTLGEPATSDVVIDYSTRDDTAIAGTDYTAATGSITILTGQTTGTISIDTLNGHQAGDVLFKVDITSADVTITSPTGKGTITPACILGSFDIVQDSYGLACPDTAAAVTITAYCDDGITVYEDYDGLVALTTSETGASFFDAASGGSGLTQYQFTGSESGVTTVYLNYNDEGNVTVTATDGAVSSSAASPTAFKTEGFVVSNPGSLFCGTTKEMSITAVGQNSAQTGCDVLEGFHGIKSLKAWFVGSTNSVSTADDSSMQPIRLDDVGGANQALSVQNKPDDDNNVSLNFINGVAKPSVEYQDNADATYVGHIKSIAFEYSSSPSDGITLPVINGENATGFNFNPYKLEITAPLASCVGSTDVVLGACTTAFAKAGDAFTQSVKMLCSDSDNLNLADNPVALQYSGEHALDHDLVAPSSGVVGSLGRGAITLSDGEASIADQTISEVGVFNLNIAGASYFGYTIPADTEVNVGRFYPDHFDMEVLDVGTLSNGCSSFTYTGQLDADGLGAIKYAISPKIRVKPYNALGQVTKNYIGDFNKFSVSGFTVNGPSFDFTQDDLDGVTTAPQRMDIVSVIRDGTLTKDVQDPSDASIGSYSDYELAFDNPFDPADLFDHFVYPKDSDSQIGAFTSDIRLTVASIVDGDSVGVTTPVLPVEIDPVDLEIRYGRWKMENAFGPETADLSMNSSAEYYDANGNWVNHADSCTDLTGLISSIPVDADLTDIPVGSGSTDFTFNAPLAAGEGGFSFSAPNSEGDVDIIVNLTTLPWLQYDWDGDGALQNHPNVRATFGRYRGHDRIIYWREVVQ